MGEVWENRMIDGGATRKTQDDKGIEIYERLIFWSNILE